MVTLGVDWHTLNHKQCLLRVATVYTIALQSSGVCSRHGCDC
jgi:hypothetical protein